MWVHVCVVGGWRAGMDARRAHSEGRALVLLSFSTPPLPHPPLPCRYLPIEGLPSFRAATLALLLGAGSPAVGEGRVAVLQSLSGTGSLRVGAAFIAKFMPGAVAYLR